MAAHIRMFSARTIVRVLCDLGFEKKRQNGSHALFVHADGRTTTVPIHGSKDIGRGLLRKIMRDAEISFDDLSNA